MSRARITALVVLVVLAVATRYLVMRGDADQRDLLPDARSDYALMDFELTAMNAAGEPSFSLTAPRLERDPGDDSAHVTEPRIALFEDASPAWRVIAESGWVRADGQEIRLEGNVSAVSSDQPPVRVGAEVLTIYPEVKALATTTPVTLSKDHNAMSGVGLRADLDSNRWELLSDVKASFVPVDG